MFEVFKTEISYIKSDNYKETAKFLLQNLPEYFYKVPASSTGKYHPTYALNEGGLVRHTKAAVRIAYELLSDPVIGEKYTEAEKDLLLVGLLIHDGFKLGKSEEKYTRVDHPLLVKEYVINNKLNIKISEMEINLLSNVVASHMGPWNKDFNGNEVLPIPSNKYERFVHMCDYLASKKFINIIFNNDEIEG